MRRYRSQFTYGLIIIPLGISTNCSAASDGITSTFASQTIETHEPLNSGWQFYFDNDISFSDEKDRNYTGGMALTLSGRRATEYWFSMDGWLNGLDRLSGFESLQQGSGGIEHHAMEFGLTVFTPDDIAAKDPIPNDHPYANMLFMANSRSRIFPETGLIFQSSLILGLLGTSVGEQVQKAIHNLTHSDEPQGWNNQISEGGELTGKYTLSAHRLLYRYQGALSYDLRGGVEAGIGYATNVGTSLSLRLGKLETPWWTFTPHQAEYIYLGQTFGSNTKSGSNPAELFIWTGINLKYSFYNAILQGQFRDSAVTFAHDDLQPLIIQGWLGVTKTFRNGLGLSFVMRKQSSEIKGDDRDDPFWSGLIISRTY